MSMRAAASAGLWSAIDLGLRQAVTFVVSVVLARLLTPADFGTIALLVFFSSLSSIFVQGGLSEALIQHQTTTLDEESSVFWWNAAASVAFGAILVAFGPALARFYGRPVLSSLMWIAAAQIVCSALGAVQTALLTRALRFERLAKVGVGSSIVSGAVAVVAAWQGLGVWALALQLVTGAAINSAALWAVADWRPSAHFRLGTIRNLLGFGGWLTVATGLEVLYSQGFALLLGKLYGLRELGLFNRAISTQQLPASAFTGTISRVAFPLFSGRQDDPAALRRGLRAAIRVVMLINVPLMAGVALLPDLILEVLFGRKWLPAAPILAIVAGSGLFYPLQVLNLQLLLARGESRTFLKLEIAKKLVGIAFVVVGSVIGVFGLAWAMLALAVVALFINAEPVRREIGYGVIAQLRDLSGVIFATMVMAAVVLLLRSMLHLPSIPQLLLLSAAGAATYAAAGFASRSSQFSESVHIARALLRRETPVVALEP